MRPEAYAKPDNEHSHQVALFMWVALEGVRQVPELTLLFAIPNGGARNIKVAVKLKAEGVKAGVPDLFLPVARGGWHGLFVEMKAPSQKPKKSGKGGVSEEQRTFGEKVQAQGYGWCVCYGWEEARDILLAYCGHNKE